MGNKRGIIPSCYSDNGNVMGKTATISNTIDADNSSIRETVVMDSDVVFEGQPWNTFLKEP